MNYHAIGMYFISRGGFALHNPQEEASLKVSAFVLSGALAFGVLILLRGEGHVCGGAAID